MLGRVSGLFGVKGWVKVFSYTQPREAILDYGRWFVKRQGEWQAAAISEGKRHGKSVIVHLEGVDDRDEAAALVDCDIAVDRAAMPDADDGSYYWADLEGLKVVRRDGTELGNVAYLMETGANDVMVVQGDRQRLVPFVREQYVKRVDLEHDVVVVDWDPDF